jgi:ubiquitin carboxyl-terminal hydrolase 16/45
MMQNSNGHQTHTPSDLLCKLKRKTTQCVDGGQHDSHEFLRHLLDIVRNEDLRVNKRKFSYFYILNILWLINLVNLIKLIN